MPVNVLVCLLLTLQVLMVVVVWLGRSQLAEAAIRIGKAFNDAAVGMKQMECRLESVEQEIAHCGSEIQIQALRNTASTSLLEGINAGLEDLKSTFDHLDIKLAPIGDLVSGQITLIRDQVERNQASQAVILAQLQECLSEYTTETTRMINFFQQEMNVSRLNQREELQRIMQSVAVKARQRLAALSALEEQYREAGVLAQTLRDLIERFQFNQNKTVRFNSSPGSQLQLGPGGHDV